MSRTQRMQVVQRVTTDHEQRQARNYTASREKVSQCETRLVELQNYHDEYQRGLAGRMTTGMDATGLRDYQAFLAKLADAVRQQSQTLSQARAECENQKLLWQHAAQRTKIIDQLVVQRQAEDQRAVHSREQRDADERALRAPRAPIGLIPGESRP